MVVASILPLWTIPGPAIIKSVLMPPRPLVVLAATRVRGVADVRSASADRRDEQTTRAYSRGGVRLLPERGFRIRSKTFLPGWRRYRLKISPGIFITPGLLQRFHPAVPICASMLAIIAAYTCITFAGVFFCCSGVNAAHSYRINPGAACRHSPDDAFRRAIRWR